MNDQWLAALLVALAAVVGLELLRRSRHPTRESDGFRPDVEGLRGLAVLLVVLFHAGFPVPGGFVGVDVFFVISGFLITGLLLRERERTGSIAFGRFYARRVRRLLPAAALVLLVCLPLVNVLVAPLDRPSVALDGAAAALSLGNMRFAMTTGDYFASVASPSPFLHFWSLGVEEQFYLLWPALLLIASRRRPRPGIGIALAAVLAASLVASVVVTDASPSWAFYALPTRAWQLAAGGLLAVGAAWLDRVPRPLVAVAGWAGTAAIGWSALALDSSVAYPGLVALLPTAGAAALIAAGARRAGPVTLLEQAIPRFLGRISYSLYLWHWPILVLGALAAGTLDAPHRLALLALALGVATLSWAWVEEPFRRGLPAFAARPRRTLALASATVLTVVTVAAGFDLVASTALDALALTPSRVGAAELASPSSGREVLTSPAVPSPSQGAVSASPRPVPSVVPARTAMPSLPPASPAATPRPTPVPYAGFALPPGVQPPLVAARDDEERLRADDCLGFENTTAPADCVYGDPSGTVTVALVGDSHAAALFPGLEAVARARGWRLLTFVKVSCPFVDLRTRDIYLKREYTECATYRDAVVARLNAVRPDLVVVSMSRWIFPVQPQDGTVAAQGAALARMIARLTSRVAIIGDPPMPSVDVPACLSAHTGDVRQCATPRSIAYGSDMLARERIAAQATGARLITITAAVCPADPCPAVVNGIIVFRDGHHLTATFSRSLAPVLDRALAPLVPKS